MIACRRPFIQNRPVLYRAKPSRTIRPIQSSLLSDVNTVSYFAGKSIILFTMFYCTLNWAHYRQIRKDLEDKNERK